MDLSDMLETGGSAEDLARALLPRLEDLRAQALAEAATTLQSWTHEIEREEFRVSVENLALYLALRKMDLTQEQQALTALGLSSLGRSEAHVLATLDAVIAALGALLGGPIEGTVGDRMASARARTTARSHSILGADPQGNSTSILVTLPSEAAQNPALVADLIEAGAASLRINCAHDSPADWAAMITHIRTAEEIANRRVPVLMDLAGPKVRTASITVPRAFLEREKKKKIKALEKAGIDPATRGPRLMQGDRIALSRDAVGDEMMPMVTLSHPDLIDSLRPGAQVWFDDGKIGARVEAVMIDRAELIIRHTPDKGARLAPEKGVNLPGTRVDIPALTEADLAALDFAVGEADMIGYSFVQTARDVRGLQGAIAARLPDGATPPALVLKIETDLALHNLPRLIVQAGGHMPVAVMIARGDLAVEIGLERLSEIQEEILWLCEAAEVPVIWATQVLEGLAKQGFASRAETTDAAMGQRAECVMLNKGPHIVEAVNFLGRVLRRMDRHQSKKSPRLAPLRAWREPDGL